MLPYQDAKSSLDRAAEYKVPIIKPSSRRSFLAHVFFDAFQTSGDTLAELGARIAVSQTSLLVLGSKPHCVRKGCLTRLRDHAEITEGP